MPQRPPQRGLLKLDYVGHPGTLESMIPVWGSGREAIADFQDGDYVGAGMNAALAASDLFIPGAIIKAGAKAGVKGLVYTARAGLKDPYGWKTVRRELGDAGLFEKGQHAHHWAIQQKGRGAGVSPKIKNQPWNLKTMPPGEKGAKMHGRMTGKYKGAPEFTNAQKLWYGTPTWAKGAAPGVVLRPAALTKHELDKRKKP